MVGERVAGKGDEVEEHHGDEECAGTYLEKSPEEQIFCEVDGEIEERAVSIDEGDAALMQCHVGQQEVKQRGSDGPDGKPCVLNVAPIEKEKPEAEAANDQAEQIEDERGEAAGDIVIDRQAA